ncbi:MAG TPA: MauE/DoxX family redox-associated membrane protein [Streptosporangiaceae bacterium]|nr:MauE/DoxX family redox-associated membrane protein [Streptosporangiaceae bacterium]
MPAAILGAKALLAVMLLVAGGAKLADLDSFAASVRLFLPRGRPGAPPAAAGLLTSSATARRIGLAVALAELGLGGASLAAPAVSPLNLTVLGAAGCFAAVSGIGFAFHRGRSCLCFGALSRRKFDPAGLIRAGAVLALAGAAAVPVAPAEVALTPAGHGLLLAGSAFIAFVAFTAARSLAASRDALPGMVS